MQHDPRRGAELIREVVGDQEVELLFLLPGVDANRYPYQEEAEYIQSLLENIEALTSRSASSRWTGALQGGDGGGALQPVPQDPGPALR